MCCLPTAYISASAFVKSRFDVENDRIAYAIGSGENQAQTLHSNSFKSLTRQVMQDFRQAPAVVLFGYVFLIQK